MPTHLDNCMNFAGRVAMRCAALSIAILLAGCATESSVVPTGGFSSLPSIAPAASAPVQDYRIGALDTLSVNVFQIKDLGIEEVQVDASGRILLPLIGAVTASGKTTTELSAEIATKLQQRYLQNPQVSVLVKNSVSQNVTVEGAVVQAGVFPLQGRTTLLQAVAMAKGPDRDANLRRVAVFREVNGQRMAAAFDLAAIRAGRAPDPEILGRDIVVVDGSAIRSVWRDVVSALPALGVFAIF